MHEQDMAIVRALVPVAWADGVFADREKETLEALLEAYSATEAERQEIRDYAGERRTIADINLQDLSADDRRVLLQHAVLLCHVDNDYSAEEQQFVSDLAARLKIPTDEAQGIVAAASERAQRLLTLL
jgi:tellurite resistance protein